MGCLVSGSGMSDAQELPLLQVELFDGDHALLLQLG
jgi:hypothetical protein